MAFDIKQMKKYHAENATAFLEDLAKNVTHKEGNMAVNLVPKQNILTAVGVTQDIIAHFQKLGGTIGSSINKIVIKLPDHEPVAIKVPTGALGLIFNGMLDQTSKDSIAKAITESILKLSNPIGGFTIPAPPTATAEEPAPLQETPINPVKQTSADFFQAPSVPTFGAPCSDAEMASNPAVALLQANRMYQPVKGTSAGARYFLIASAPEGNIAARFKNTQISLRVEGDILSDKKRLQDNGFNISPGYASMHLVDCLEPMMMKRAVGAVLLGLQLNYVTPFPDMSKIIGKGA